MTSSTSYDLRDAKVGSSVVVSREHGADKVLTVTKVQQETKGYHAGEAKRVWLSDGSSWTGKGDEWGDGKKSYWSRRRQRAHLILDRALFDQENAAAIAQRKKKALRDKRIKQLTDVASKLTDEELAALSTTLQLDGRFAAASLAAFAVNLFRGTAHY